MRCSRRRALLFLSLVAVGFGALPAFSQNEQKPFSAEELDQILAPIALYPDSLLSQVMMAATYPLEIVEAARWSRANPALKGDAAVAAVKDKSWDVSVKSLVAFPPVLAQMNEHLDWTQKLGDAMIAQEQDIADSIQRLRARAADAGNLQSTKEQAVSIQTSGSERIISIAQADPQVVYVPSYNPSWAYGAWPYPSYPPVYYPFGGALATGFMWGIGFAAAGAIFGGWNWGYGRGNSWVNVNPTRAVSIDNNFNRANVGSGNRWQHEASHRKGVAYRDASARQRYGQSRPGADQRQQFRGRLEQGSRPGNLANARPSAGTGTGVQRPGAGSGAGVQRPSGGAAELARAQQRAPEAARGGRVQGGSGFSGVNRGQQVNREAARGRAQQARARSGGGGRPGGGRPGGRR
jgi:hypothetical protein